MASAQISEQGRILYVWTGSEWVPVNGSGGGGLETYYQSASPTSPNIGDLWVDEDGSVEDTEAGIFHDHDLQYLSLNTASNTYLTINNASSTYIAQTSEQFIINTASTAAIDYSTSYTNSASSSLLSYVDTQVTNLIDSAPGALDTLNELSAALNDDPNFYTTIQSVYLTQSNASAAYQSKIPIQSSAPSSPNIGDMWSDNTDPESPVLKVYNGVSWIELSGGGSEIRSGRLLLMGA